ncbi:MAG: fumarate hydratase [Verrucomicrobiota bacterium]
MQHLQKNSLLEAIFRTVEEFTKSRSKGLIHASGFSLAEDSVKLLGKCYPLGKFERPLKEYLRHLGISASVGSGAALTGNPLNSTVSSVFMVAMQQSILEIIRRTSAEIPADVHQAILKSLEAEKKGTISESALKIIDRNIALAKAKSQPICQDTGSIIFYVECPLGFDQIAFEEAARTAVTEATRKGYLRQNSVDSLTGVNDGTNVGPGSPTIHFHQHRSPEISVRLILKGGGCENVGAQYSLPNEKLKANRDLDGCRKVILDAVVQAQGKGCGPGILGVCIGGDRATGYEFSKQQFMRRLDDRNPNPELDKLEQDILHTANELGIGPMGFGGKTTLLGVKICAANRLPASFFVSVSYMCWAYRRQGATLDSQGNIQQWLY